MTRWLVAAFATVVLVAACSSDSGLSDESLAELRASNEYFDEFTDDQVQAVATALCDGISSESEDGQSSEDGDVMDQAWSTAGVEEVGVDEILASLDLVEAACPDSFTSEFAADNEPIPISFTLVGTEGEEFTYSVIGGCEGDGGYSDVKDGMLFNLTNEQGDVLGVARLEDSEQTSLGCEVSGAFSVTFGDLDDDTLYFVGDRAGNRGELAYTGSELKEQGAIELSLG
jgi:hypothetical protein